MGHKYNELGSTIATATITSSDGKTDTRGIGPGMYSALVQDGEGLLYKLSGRQYPSTSTLTVCGRSPFTLLVTDDEGTELHNEGLDVDGVSYDFTLSR